MSDANRGPGFAGPTRADQQSDDRAADRTAVRSDSPPSPQSPSAVEANGNVREDYGTTTQVMQGGSPSSPNPAASPVPPGESGVNGSGVNGSGVNGSVGGSAGPASANGTHSASSPNTFGSPWAATYSSSAHGGGPQSGQSTYSTNGNGFYSPSTDFAPDGDTAPTAAAGAPGDALPAGEQPSPPVPTWDPVTARPRKPLKERWTDFTAKLTGKSAGESPEAGDGATAERVWASSAAAGGIAAGVASTADLAAPDSPTSTSDDGAGSEGAGSEGSVASAGITTSPIEADQDGVDSADGGQGHGVDETAAAQDQTVQGQEPVPLAGEGEQTADVMHVSPWAPGAPGAGPATAVIPVVEGQPVPAPGPVYAVAAPPVAASKSKAGTPRRTRKARLRLARLDPWSVMKTAFLFSIAAGIMLVVAVYVVWTVIGSSGLFDSVNDIIKSVISTPNDTTPFRVEEYVNTQKVLGVAALLACVDVIIFTALATLGSFLYNLAATMLGGLEVTLAED